MEPFQKGINNKSSVHLLEAAEETQFNPSIMCKPWFCSPLWVNIEGRTHWMIYKNIFLMHWSGEKRCSMRFHITFQNLAVVLLSWLCTRLLFGFVSLLPSDLVHRPSLLHLSAASGKWKRQKTSDHMKEHVRASVLSPRMLEKSYKCATMVCWHKR